MEIIPVVMIWHTSPEVGETSSNTYFLAGENMKTIKVQSGIGLIEALIASVVFAIGIGAVLQLQSSFFKNSSAANARSIAMGIAQEKVEDLRGFKSKSDADPDIFDFVAISNDAGGACTEQADNDVCTIALASGDVSRDNITFSRNWVVTDYYKDGSVGNEGEITTTVPTGASVLDIVQKRVVVTVTWTDTDNTAQTASLDTVINQFSGISSSGALASGAGGSGESPVVTYTPSQDVEVVAVSVGDTVTRETLVPTSNGDSQVKFTAYTYDDGGTLLRQEDFLTVSCNCDYTTDREARTASYAEWDSGTKSYKDYSGELKTKNSGVRTNGGTQDPLCETCCKDHHDPGSSAVNSAGDKICDPASDIDQCFDPFRSVDDYTDGKHNHYTSAGVIASSGSYLESCRMKRVDGFWRVYQDWHRVDISAFPISEITDTGTEATYGAYVQGVVDALLEDSGITKFSGQTITKPAKPSGVNRVDTNKITLAVDEVMNLTGRAIYIDYLNSELLTAVRAKKSNSEDYLIDIPFYEVDVTNRAPLCLDSDTGYGGWCSNSVGVLVGFINTNGANGISLGAGEIKGVSSAGNTNNITFAMRRSGSGLMGLTFPVDSTNYGNSDIFRDTALVHVDVSGTVTARHDLNVTLTSSSVIDSGTLLVTPASGSGVCTTASSEMSYTCDVPNNNAGSIRFSGASGSETCSIDPSSSDIYSSSAVDQSVALNIVCVATPVLRAVTLCVISSAGTEVESGGVTSSGSYDSCLTSATTCGSGNKGLQFSCQVLNDSIGTFTFSGLRKSGGSSVSCGGDRGFTTNDATLTLTCSDL